MSPVALRDAKHAQRLDWLRTYPHVRELPGVHDRVSGRQTEALDVALKQMKFLRLYAPSCLPAATRWRIRLLVSELRGESISAKDRQWALHGKL